MAKKDFEKAEEKDEKDDGKGALKDSPKLDLKKQDVVKVKVKKGKCVFESNGKYAEGEEFTITIDRAKKLAGDVDIVG